MKTKRNFSIFIVLILSVLFLAISCKKDDDKKDDNNSNTPIPCTWQTVFFDDFNRPDGPIGSDYSIQSSDYDTADIYHNQLRFLGGLYWAIRYTTPVSGNEVRVSIKFFVNDSSDYNFALDVLSQDLGGNFQQQQGCFGGVDMNTISISKIMGTVMQPLISKPIQIESGHQYRLEFTYVRGAMDVELTDLDTGNKVLLSYIDTGTAPTGNIVSINGLGGNLNLFDDYKVEICQ